MNVDIWTTPAVNGGQCTSRMATMHQPTAAVLALTDPDGNRFTMYGPPEAAEAFDKMAAAFNEAHTKYSWTKISLDPAPEQV